jgi:hypothetical protein
MFCNQQKRPHRGLPFGIMFCLGLINTSASGTFRPSWPILDLTVIGGGADIGLSQ